MGKHPPKRKSDNICKLLAEKYPEAFIEWLAPLIGGIDSSQPVELLKTELPIEPIRADFVAFLRMPHLIFHIEFQLDPESEPPMPLRLLDYAVRLYRLYRLPVIQVVILLRDSPKARGLPDEFELGTTRHSYHVIRLWEMDAEALLKHPALLPLAVLAKTDDPEKLLRKVAEKTATIRDAGQRRDARAASFILAGLRFPEDLIQRLLKEDTMRESVTYQTILREGLMEGQQLGLQQGRREEILRVVNRQLVHRFSRISKVVQKSLDRLTTEKLEDLSVAILDFTTMNDLKAWLKEHH